MKISQSVILLLTLFIGICQGQQKKSNFPGKIRHDNWIADIDYFENEYLANSKTFKTDSVIACKKRLKELRLKIDSLNDNQVILELSRCVAMADNGHTTIHLNGMKKIPVRFFWFTDGLYVIKTDSVNSAYLGYKVEAIDSVKINEVLNRLNPYLSGIASWKKFISTNYLCSPQILNGIGISSEEALTLTLSYKGNTQEVRFTYDNLKDSWYEYNAWAMLYPDEKQSDWAHVLDADSPLPLYLKKMKEGVFYEFIEDEKIAYFNINALWYKCPDFKGKINEFIDSLQIFTDYNVVIDLRYYTGGNFMIPLRLATKPPKIIDEDKKIFLITTNMTFSAGLVTAARVKYFAGEKAIVVGEHVGDSLKFRAEGVYYKLPYAKIRIQDSKRDHDWEDNTFIPFKTFFFNLFLGVPAKSLDVDKEIKLDFEDYLKKRDPIMNWIIEQY